MRRCHPIKEHHRHEGATTMTLPYDIARCAGVGYEAEGTDGWYWREGCADCRRREPGHPERQWMMTPPVVIAVECEYRIAREQA
jgi:hypothetical protein